MDWAYHHCWTILFNSTWYTFDITAFPIVSRYKSRNITLFTVPATSTLWYKEKMELYLTTTKGYQSFANIKNHTCSYGKNLHLYFLSSKCLLDWCQMSKSKQEWTKKVQEFSICGLFLFLHIFKNKWLLASNTLKGRWHFSVKHF